MDELITIIIPCRNEEKFIGPCLDSILEQDYPPDRMEILIADGMSDDNTRQILSDYAAEHGCIRFFQNPKKFVPAGLNILISKSKGMAILRLDAHSRYPADYISKCVRALNQYKADNVGGCCVTLAQEETTLGKAIVLVLSHRFGVGNSLFRLGVKRRHRLTQSLLAVFGGQCLIESECSMNIWYVTRTSSLTFA